jgi:hypothetical protein
MRYEIASALADDVTVQLQHLGHSKYVVSFGPATQLIIRQSAPDNKA